MAACKITAGLDCASCNDIRGKSGLFNEIYVINYDDVDSTLGINGIYYTGVAPFYVTGIAISAYANAYKFCTKKQSGAITHELVVTDGGYKYYTQTLTGSFIQSDAQSRLDIDGLIGGNFYIVARDFNNRFWLLGQGDGVELTAATQTTGTAPGDAAGYTFTFTGNVDGLAPQLLKNGNYEDTLNYLESLL
jgi:hypothetical protein